MTEEIYCLLEDEVYRLLKSLILDEHVSLLSVEDEIGNNVECLLVVSAVGDTFPCRF